MWKAKGHFLEKVSLENVQDELDRSEVQRMNAAFWVVGTVGSKV